MCLSTAMHDKMAITQITEITGSLVLLLCDDENLATFFALYNTKRYNNKGYRKPIKNTVS